MSDIWHFILEQDGMVVAEGEGPHADVNREGHHYAIQYAMDGDIRLRILPGPLPEPKP